MHMEYHICEMHMQGIPMSGAPEPSTPTQQPKRPSVLFLCTANSARSIMAEGIFRHLAQNDFHVMSAGTEPAAAEPEALVALEAQGIPTDSLYSKSLNEVELSNFDYVISLCDRARAECQSLCSDNTFIAWDFPDPVTSQRSDAFGKTALELAERIRMFLLITRKHQGRPKLFNASHEFYKALGDPLRLQMILTLHTFGEVCVCQFVDATDMSQPKVSRHLAQLRDFGLLTDRKKERWVYYRINPALADWMASTIAIAALHNPHLIPDRLTPVESNCN